MSQVRRVLRIVVWAVAFAYWGLHLLLLGLTAVIRGPGEPGSSMSFEEFHVRSASGQWLRDEIDSFIIATTFCIAVSVAVLLATTQREAHAVGCEHQKGINRWMPGFLSCLRVFLICACILACVGVYSRLGNHTDYGGNTAALAACNTFVTGLKLISDERNNKPVSIADIKPSEQRYLTNLAGLDLLPDAKILVKPVAVTSFGGPREIIAVCDRAFDNVPRRLFGKAPYTHAVAYADGSYKLITVEEFKALDLTKFVDVKKLQTNDGEAGFTGRGDSVPGAGL